MSQPLAGMKKGMGQVICSVFGHLWDWEYTESISVYKDCKCCGYKKYVRLKP